MLMHDRTEQRNWNRVILMIRQLANSTLNNIAVVAICLLLGSAMAKIAEADTTEAASQVNSHSTTFNVECRDQLQINDRLLQSIVMGLKPTITKSLPDELASSSFEYAVIPWAPKESQQHMFYLQVIGRLDDEALAKVGNETLKALETYLLEQLSRKQRRLVKHQDELTVELAALSDAAIELRSQLLAFPVVDRENRREWLARQTQLKIDAKVDEVRAELLEKQLRRATEQREMLRIKLTELGQAVFSLSDSLQHLKDDTSDRKKAERIATEIAKLRDAEEEVKTERQFWAEQINRNRSELSALQYERGAKQVEEVVVTEMLEETRATQKRIAEAKANVEQQLARVELRQSELLEAISESRQELRASQAFEFSIWE